MVRLSADDRAIVRCLPPLLQARFGSASRRDSAGAPKAGAARTRGGTLAGGASRTSGASGPERPRAVMSAPAPLPKEIYESAKRGELPKVVKWLRKGGLIDALCRVTAAEGQLSRRPSCQGCARRRRDERAVP